MITFKTKYTFKNGVTCEFTICNSSSNPIAKTQWSCKVDRKNIAPLMEEYTTKCVPFVYQQIADFTGGSVMWVDKNTGHHQVFEPSKHLSN